MSDCHEECPYKKQRTRLSGRCKAYFETVVQSFLRLLDYLVHCFGCVIEVGCWGSDKSITDRGFRLLCRWIFTTALRLSVSCDGMNWRAITSRLPTVHVSRMLR